MRSSSIITAVVLFGAAMAGPISTIGCYKSSTGTTLKDSDPFNSQGYCSTACADSAAFATSGNKCYCGDEIPNDGDKVDDSKCTVSCPGYPNDNCGGPGGLFYFYDMGTSTSIPKADKASSPSSTEPSTHSATSSSKPSVVTLAGQTVTATATSDVTSAATNEKSSSGPSKAGIAAGVVVGVVAIAAIAGGLFLFMRNRKRRAIEEEHRRNAAVSSFIGAGKPPTSSGSASSFTDTRLDPVMAQRRMSDGSIADNQDYSRRILKVTNA